MKKHTLIFLGQSGCGKGTQAERALAYLKEKDSETPIVQLIMGDLFRKFWNEKGYTNELSKKIMDAGGLQPAFLQIYLWGTFFMNKLTGNEHLVIDGTPRRLIDSKMIDTAFRFYKREKPIVFYIDVTDENCIARIKSRAQKEQRAEDMKDEVIAGRLDWFKKYALEALLFFKDKEPYIFAQVDGNGTPDEVWEQVKSYLD